MRKKPYATRHPANVAVSAMINSHIAIFFAGMENVGFSITLMLEWDGMLICACVVPIVIDVSRRFSVAKA